MAKNISAFTSFHEYTNLANIFFINIFRNRCSFYCDDGDNDDNDDPGILISTPGGSRIMASSGEGASKMAPMWPGYGEIMTPCQRRRQSLLSYFWKRKFRLNMRNEISLNEEKNYQQPRKIWIGNSPIQEWKSSPWTIVFNLCRFATFFYGWQVEFTWELRPPGHIIASWFQRIWRKPLIIGIIAWKCLQKLGAPHTAKEKPPTTVRDNAGHNSG